MATRKHFSCALLAVATLAACATTTVPIARPPFATTTDGADAATTPSPEPPRSPDPYFGLVTRGEPCHSAGGAWPRDFVGVPDLQQAAPELPKSPQLTSDWGTWDNKSYLIPAFEIITFEFLLNQYDRNQIDDPAYDSTFSSFENNLKRKWTIDNDPFDTNQVWHPYAGSLYFGFARSAGLNFWESMGYTFVGSLLWEYGGETGAPSVNDQVATGIGGSFIGEVLFRMASYLLEGEPDPGFWTETAAGVVSPSTWLNRHLFGDKFKVLFPSKDPAVFSRIGIGGSLNTHVKNRGVSQDVSDNKVVANFDMDYGLPGKDGYHYERPFDYFHVEGAASSNSGSFIENVFVRGLLFGGQYGSGSYAGIAGLYGTYCYLSPEVFQLSTTALALGTTGQWLMSESVALQCNFLAGVGYGAAGTTSDTVADRDYHYGIAPQGLAGLRFVFGSLAMLDLSVRDYYVSGQGSNSNGSSENILREQAQLMFRVWERHSIGMQYDYSRRDAPDVGQNTRLQTVQTVSLVYSYLLGNTKSGMAAVR